MLDHFIKRIVPLALAFTLSVLVTVALQSFWSPEVGPAPLRSPINPTQPKWPAEKCDPGSGTAACSGLSYGAREEIRSRKTSAITPYRITFQPRALYTDAARENNIQGRVRLKIVLLASGQVGAITPVTELPHGLTEQAISAARAIRFEPRTVKGVPVSVIVTREYTFTIY